MEEMLAGKPPTTGERERREAQRRSAGNGEGRPSGEALGTVEMLAAKPPTTGERERREAQRRNAGNGGDVGDKTANHSEKNK